ncbi:MAG: N-acetylmuramoyl-L-alanine amidase [Holosporaceae bacterium]|jgi:N-acetylmuramoyl-L-alanine amidase|nr:N-acetylmuramoyl-L-alanine amidase [Holosporaceae bacterium]
MTEYGMLSRKMRTFLGIVCLCFSGACAALDGSSQIQAVKKIYLKKEKDNYFLCIDFNGDILSTQRVHTLPNGIKAFLSFKKEVALPKSKRLSHNLIKGCFFEKFSPESLMFMAAFKKDVIFTDNESTSRSMKIGFKINKKPLIVLDAGHGGKDLGVTGIGGNVEKNITLATAIELWDLLRESAKYQVILIRDGDIFIPDSERILKINSLHPDLLISFHTNDNDACGISVYTIPNLNLLKQSPNSSVVMENDDYYKTLSLSKRFARCLIGYIPKICRKNRPRRSGHLKILEVSSPAVLVEVGSILNRKDNELLHMRSFREKFNYAILYAIDKFFGKGKS